MGISGEAKCKVLHLGWEMPGINTGWGRKELRADLWKKGLVCLLLLDKNQTRAENTCSQPRKPTLAWAASKARERN